MFAQEIAGPRAGSGCRVGPFLGCVLLVLGILASAGTAGAQRGGGQGGGVTVSVRVTDYGTGETIEQVRLELILFPDRLVQTAFTDNTGRAQLNAPVVQTYHLRATRMDYQPAEVLVDPIAPPGHASTNFPVDLQMRRTASPSNSPAGKISSRELSLPKPAVDEFHKGIELLNEKKDPKGSIEHFQKAIDASPGYYEAYFLMGMAQLQTGNSTASEASFRKAIGLNEKFLEPYYPLSAALHALGRDDDALTVLEKAHGLDPSGWRWPFELARLRGNRLEFDKAMPLAQEAATKKGVPAKVHLLLADIYSNTQQPQKALEEMETFAKLEPTSPLMPKVQAAMEKLRHMN